MEKFMLKQYCPIEDDYCIKENTDCENCYIYQNFLEDIEVVEDEEIETLNFFLDDEDDQDEDIIKFFYDDEILL